MGRIEIDLKTARGMTEREEMRMSEATVDDISFTIARLMVTISTLTRIKNEKIKRGEMKVIPW